MATVDFYLRYTNEPPGDAIAVVIAGVDVVPRVGERVTLNTRHGWLHDLTVYDVEHHIDQPDDDHRIVVSVDVPDATDK